MLRKLPAAVLAVLLLHGGAAAGAPLIDQYARPVEGSALSGHWLLVYFGYASCPDICPVALRTMSRALERAGADAARVEPIFVSLDPERDTPERLRVYAAHFSPRIRALTGSPAAIAEAAGTFGVPWKPQASGQIDHGVFFYLVGPDGVIVETFHASANPVDVASRLRSRLSGSKPR